MSVKADSETDTAEGKMRIHTQVSAMNETLRSKHLFHCILQHSSLQDLMHPLCMLNACLKGSWVWLHISADLQLSAWPWQNGSDRYGYFNDRYIFVNTSLHNISEFSWVDLTLGGAFSLGSIMGYLLGGGISQHFGKRIVLIVSNFGSFIIWVSFAFEIERAELVIVARFSMGVFSAAASVCVGK